MTTSVSLNRDFRIGFPFGPTAWNPRPQIGPVRGLRRRLPLNRRAIVAGMADVPVAWLLRLISRAGSREVSPPHSEDFERGLKADEG